jgi:hypothetical protein
LGVWDKQLGISEGIFLKLCEGGWVPEGESHALNEFYKELIRRWPELDSIPEERVGDFALCPWSTGPLERSGMHMIINCVWPKADDVCAYVMELAEKYDLVLYDPQEGAFRLPKAKKKSSWWPF